MTADDVDRVRALEVHGSQRRFAASVTASLAEAEVPPIVDGAPLEPWYRAVAAGGDLVGFVMLARPTRAQPDPLLWRLLVDRIHQGRGIGTAVVEQVVKQCRHWDAHQLIVRYAPSRGGPERFWLARGFTPTGRLPDGRVRAARDLCRARPQRGGSVRRFGAPNAMLVDRKNRRWHDGTR